MAKPFNLTAQLNLVGPTNLRPVVNNLRKQLSGINTNVNVNISRGASRNVRVLNTQVQGLTKSLQQANAQATTLSSTMSSLAKSLQNIANNSKTTSTNLNNTANAANQVGKSVQQAATQMEEFGRISGLALRRYAGFTVATTLTFGFARAVSNAFTEALKFERELIKVAQVTNTTVKGLKSLTDEIGRLSRSFGVSSTELLEVSRTLSQAGLSANETRKALEALAKSSLAPTFNDIRNTTEGVVAIMSQFGIRARDMEKVLGSLNAVAGKFAVEAEDLISVVRRTGGVFKAAAGDVGSPIKQLNELIAVFTSVRATTRESAESIATGLRTIFTRIQRPSTLKFLRQLGVDLQDVEGKFVGPYKAIQQLNQALQSLDPRDVRFSKIVEQLGGFRQVGKLIPAIQQFAKAQEALGVAMTGQASLSKDAERAQQSLLVQTQKVREEFLQLFRDIAGDSTFQVFAKGALGLASSLIKLADSFRPILPMLTALATIKAGSALKQFGTGFFGGIRSGGGAQAVGQNLAGGATGQGTQAASQALAAVTKANTTAIMANTKATIANNIALNQLVRRMSLGFGFGGGGGRRRPRVTPRLGGPIYPRGFNSGGFVPGTGNHDSVPAMLTPGEFVIKKSAAKSLGSDYLQKANRYANGGGVFSINSKPKYGMFAYQLKKGKVDKAATQRGIGSEKFGAKARKELFEEHSKRLLKEGASQADFIKQSKRKDDVVGAPAIRYLDETMEQDFLKGMKKSVNSFIDGIISAGTGTSAAELAKAAEGVDKKGIKKKIRDGMQLETLAGLAFEGFINAATKGTSTAESTQARWDFKPSSSPKAFNALFGGGAGKIPYADGKLTVDSNNLLSILGKAVGSGTNSTKYSNPEAAVRRKGSLDRRQSSRARRESARRGTGVALQGTEQEGTTGIRGLSFDDEKGYARGGRASGSDTVPALLTPGEFVINRESASRIGLANLNRMNQGKMKGYNRGGAVLGGLAFAAPAIGAFADETFGGQYGAAAGAGSMAGFTALSMLDEEAGLLKKSFVTLGVGAIAAADGFINAKNEFEQIEAQKEMERVFKEIDHVMERFAGAISTQTSQLEASFNSLNTAVQRSIDAQINAPKGIIGAGREFVNNLFGDDVGDNDLSTRARNQAGGARMFFAGIQDFFTGSNQTEVLSQQGLESAITQQSEIARPAAGRARETLRAQFEERARSDVATGARPEDTTTATSNFMSANSAQIDAMMAADEQYIRSQHELERLRKAHQDGEATAQQVAAQERDLENKRRSALQALEEEAERLVVAEAAANRFNETVDLMGRRFSAMGAVAARVGQQMENSTAAMNRSVASAQGQAQFGFDQNQFSSVFSNMAGFTQAEIQSSIAGLGTVSGLSDNESFAELSNVLSTTSSLQAQLPQVISDSLAESGGSLTGDFSNILEENLSAAAGGGDQPFLQDMIDSIVTSISTGEDRQSAVGQEAINQIVNQSMEKLSERAAMASKAMEQIAKVVDEQMKRLADAINTQAGLIQAANASQERVNQIMFRQAQQMAELTGREMSLEEMFAPFESRLASLTGGLTNPNEIANQRALAEAKRKELEDSMSGMAPDDPRMENLASEAAQVTAALNQTHAALELLASDTTRQAALVQKLNKLNEARSGAQNIMEAIMTGDPQELMKFTRGMDLVAAQQSGMLNTSMIGNEDRGLLFQMFRMLQPLAGADAGMGIPEGAFDTGGLIGSMMGDFGLDGGPAMQGFNMLATTNKGESNQERVLLQRLAVLNEQQTAAARELATIDQQAQARQEGYLRTMPAEFARQLSTEIDKIITEINVQHAAETASAQTKPDEPVTGGSGKPRGPGMTGTYESLGPATSGPALFATVNSGRSDGTMESPHPLQIPSDAEDLRTGEYGITPEGDLYQGLRKGGKADSGYLDKLLMQKRRPDQEILEKLAGQSVPGFGDRDKVAALLTPEEYVVNKKASVNNRAILEQINALGASRKFRLVAASQGGPIGLQVGGVASGDLSKISNFKELSSLRQTAQFEKYAIDAWGKKYFNTRAAINAGADSPELLETFESLKRQRPRNPLGQFMSDSDVMNRFRYLEDFEAQATKAMDAQNAGLRTKMKANKAARKVNSGADASKEINKFVQEAIEARQAGTDLPDAKRERLFKKVQKKLTPDVKPGITIDGVNVDTGKPASGNAIAKEIALEQKSEKIARDLRKAMELENVKTSVPKSPPINDLSLNKLDEAAVKIRNANEALDALVPKDTVVATPRNDISLNPKDQSAIQKRVRDTRQAQLKQNVPESTLGNQADLDAIEARKSPAGAASGKPIPGRPKISANTGWTEADIRSWMKKGSESLNLKGLPPAYVDSLSSSNVNKLWKGIQTTTRADGARMEKAQDYWYELSRDARKKGFRPSLSAGGARPSVPTRPPVGTSGNAADIKAQIESGKIPDPDGAAAATAKMDKRIQDAEDILRRLNSGDMNAQKFFGLANDAHPDEVIAAHKRSRLKFHPDHVQDVRLKDIHKRIFSKVNSHFDTYKTNLNTGTSVGTPKTYDPADMRNTFGPKPSASATNKAAAQADDAVDAAKKGYDPMNLKKTFNADNPSFLKKWWRAKTGPDGKFAMRGLRKIVEGMSWGGVHIKRGATAFGDGIKIGAGGAWKYGGKPTLNAFGDAWTSAKGRIASDWSGYLDELYDQGVFSRRPSGTGFKATVGTLFDEMAPTFKQGLQNPNKLLDDIYAEAFPNAGQSRASNFVKSAWNTSGDIASFLGNKSLDVLRKVSPGSAKVVDDVLSGTAKVAGSAKTAYKNPDLIKKLPVRYGVKASRAGLKATKALGKFALRGLPFLSTIMDMADANAIYEAHNVAIDKVMFEANQKKLSGDFGYLQGVHDTATEGDSSTELAGGGLPMKLFSYAKQQEWVKNQIRQYTVSEGVKLQRLGLSVATSGITDGLDLAHMGAQYFGLEEEGVGFVENVLPVASFGLLGGDVGAGFEDRTVLGKTPSRIEDSAAFLDRFGRQPNQKELDRINAGNFFVDDEIRANFLEESALRGGEAVKRGVHEMHRGDALDIMLKASQLKAGGSPSPLESKAMTTFMGGSFGYGGPGLERIHKMFSKPKSIYFDGTYKNAQTVLDTGKWPAEKSLPTAYRIWQDQQGDLKEKIGGGRAVQRALSRQQLAASQLDLSIAWMDEGAYKRIIDAQQAAQDFMLAKQGEIQQSRDEEYADIRQSRADVLKRFGLPESLADQTGGRYRVQNLPSKAKHNQAVYDWMSQNYGNSAATLAGGSSMPLESFKENRWFFDETQSDTKALASHLPLRDSQTGNTIRSSSIYNPGGNFPMEIWPFVEDMGSHYVNKMTNPDFRQKILSRLVNVQSFNPEKGSVQLGAAPPSFTSQLQSQPREAMKWVEETLDNLLQNELLTAGEINYLQNKKKRENVASAIAGKEAANVANRVAGTTHRATEADDAQLLEQMIDHLHGTYGEDAKFDKGNITGYNAAALRVLEHDLRIAKNNKKSEVDLIIQARRWHPQITPESHPQFYDPALPEGMQIGPKLAVEREEEFRNYYGKLQDENSLHRHYMDWVKQHASEETLRDNMEAPKYQSGGEVGGKRHFAGGTLIEAEQGEMVMSRDATRKNRPALEAMNKGLAKFQDGGLVTAGGMPAMFAQNYEKTAPLFKQFKKIRDEQRDATKSYGNQIHGLYNEKSLVTAGKLLSKYKQATGMLQDMNVPDVEFARFIDDAILGLSNNSPADGGMLVSDHVPTFTGSAALDDAYIRQAEESRDFAIRNGEKALKEAKAKAQQTAKDVQAAIKKSRMTEMISRDKEKEEKTNRAKQVKAGNVGGTKKELQGFTQTGASPASIRGPGGGMATRQDDGTFAAAEEPQYQLPSGEQVGFSQLPRGAQQSIQRGTSKLKPVQPAGGGAAGGGITPQQAAAVKGSGGGTSGAIRDGAAMQAAQAHDESMAYGGRPSGAAYAEYRDKNPFKHAAQYMESPEAQAAAEAVFNQRPGDGNFMSHMPDLSSGLGIKIGDIPGAAGPGAGGGALGGAKVEELLQKILDALTGGDDKNVEAFNAGGAGGPAGGDFAAFATTMRESAATLSTAFEQFGTSATTIREAADIFNTAADKITQAAQSLASIPETFTHKHDMSVSISNETGFADALATSIQDKVAEQVFDRVKNLLPSTDVNGETFGER